MDESRALEFPFHYWQESGAYTFYRVPKILFQEPKFSALSTEAKLLYGLMLDRMQLSAQNNWFDENGRVYIYYTVENVMEALSCGKNKAVKLLSELDDKNGIGLITRRRQGLGKPDMVFVHKCVLAEASKLNFKRFENQTSGGLKSKPQEVLKSNPNNTENNNTDISDNNRIYLQERTDGCESFSAYRSYQAYFSEQLEIEILKQRYPYDVEVLDEILELMVETVTSQKTFLRICGEDKPREVVKSRLMKLDSSHIEYVLTCLKENTTQIRNIKQYLLAALYNAPTTIDSYYAAQVRHDFGWGGQIK